MRKKIDGARHDSIIHAPIIRQLINDVSHLIGHVDLHLRRQVPRVVVGRTWTMTFPSYNTVNCVQLLAPSEATKLPFNHVNANLKQTMTEFIECCIVFCLCTLTALAGTIGQLSVAAREQGMRVIGQEIGTCAHSDACWHTTRLKYQLD